MASPVQHGLKEGCLAYAGLWYDISPLHNDVGGRRGNKKPSDRIQKVVIKVVLVQNRILRGRCQRVKRQVQTLARHCELAACESADR